MSDSSEQLSDGEGVSGHSEEQLVRLVSAAELDRLEARRDHLTETVEELEAENTLLRQEIATLRHRLEQKDQQRQQVVENYERILAARQNCGDDAENDSNRLLGDVFF
ncbi:hypothetical protein [Halovenus halobia]|uniref:hypothetical protein n=1 Tax=Halovenus halobia TaxID=3396622 RepID=UPI003F577DCF